MINKKLSEIVNKCYEINKSGKYTMFCWFSGHCNVIDISYTKGKWEETKEQIYIAKVTKVNEKNLEKILEQLNSLK